MALQDPEQLKLLKKKPKYHNRPTTVGDIWFQSAAEADRWKILCALEKNGNIRNLKRQAAFDLVVNGVMITKYKADFVYFDIDTGEKVVEDVKGCVTKIFEIKRNLMLAIHGITIKEVKV